MPVTFNAHHEHLGPVLKRLRRRAKLTQAELRGRIAADGGQLGQAWLSKIETGKADPSEQLLDRMLSALGSDRMELKGLLALHGINDSANRIRDTWSDPVGVRGHDPVSVSHVVRSDVPLADAVGEFVSTYQSLGTQDRNAVMDNLRAARRRD